MRIADAEQSLFENWDGFGGGDGAAAADDLLDCFAVYKLHYHVRLAVLDQKSVERGEVGVVEIGLGFGLGAEALLESGLPANWGWRRFDGYGAVERRPWLCRQRPCRLRRAFLGSDSCRSLFRSWSVAQLPTAVESSFAAADVASMRTS